MDRTTAFLARTLTVLGALLAVPATLIAFHVALNGGISREETRRFVRNLARTVNIPPEAIALLASTGLILGLALGLTLVVRVAMFAEVAHQSLPPPWLCPTLTCYLVPIASLAVREIIALGTIHYLDFGALVLLLIPVLAFLLSLALWRRVVRARRWCGVGEPHFPS